MLLWFNYDTAFDVTGASPVAVAKGTTPRGHSWKRLIPAHVFLCNSKAGLRGDHEFNEKPFWK